MDSNSVIIRSLKLGETEQKVATVELPREKAIRLTKMGTVKIGWVQCTVKERVAVARCYNCPDIGHIAVDCKKPKAKEETCINCGEQGHRTKDCKNSTTALHAKKVDIDWTKWRAQDLKAP
ncbi:unnamed protein product [Psylliodes chrysocephalus]|uniref:CCHC-type domain-containing protein n=1 Tax=Psylliodes chrysocephalus TaxID=3402493 RepID=A0A9P0CS80_9CUCU|nr:unnamed protein product [Psylliodes chrysocephala]